MTPITNYSDLIYGPLLEQFKGDNVPPVDSDYYWQDTVSQGMDVPQFQGTVGTELPADTVQNTFV